MEKKPYTPPTITEHGDAVRQTKGFGGEYWEMMTPKFHSDVEYDPKAE
jgi:hypothetical protein